MRFAAVPRFVVFEGVDGVGKSTLARALADYYRTVVPAGTLYAGAFPGSEPGTIGEWVYRLHHNQVPGLAVESIAPAALQLMHVAAHVDAIQSRLAPTLRQGYVILDRYWWSTYAYARLHLSPDQAWALVASEFPFWEDLPRPEIIYLVRQTSLKAEEIDSASHQLLTSYYSEVISRNREAGARVHKLTNDGPLDAAWHALLSALDLPSFPIEATLC
jgi:thymidylate kinase